MMLLVWTSQQPVGILNQEDFQATHSLLPAINLLHPFNGLRDTFFQGYLRIMLQVSSGFRKVHMFDFGGKRFRLFVSDFGIILAQILQYKIGDVFYLVFPFFFATDVVNLSRFEIINYVSKGAAGILDIVEDAAGTQGESIGFVILDLIDERGNEPPGRAKILGGT